MIDGATILITGGTGTFGQAFTRRAFQEYKPKKVIVYSRDEYKQYVMQQAFQEHNRQMRYFVGDVRDRERLYRAFNGVDCVVHAAAMKQVPSCEYNPFEAVKTNIHGAQNVINAAIDQRVKRVIAFSTDKAVNPVNLYGATKLVSDKLFISANAYVGSQDTAFSVVRYGNVAGSRGSVIPFFRQLVKEGAYKLPITDFRMTRFWITLDEAVDLVFMALRHGKGGEIYVRKIPSFRIVDLAKVISSFCTTEEVGIREGEKLHETMITEYDSLHTYEYGGGGFLEGKGFGRADFYIIYPGGSRWWDENRITPGGKLVADSFRYSSDTNSWGLTVDEIAERLCHMKED